MKICDLDLSRYRTAIVGCQDSTLIQAKKALVDRKRGALTDKDFLDWLRKETILFNEIKKRKIK